MKHIVMFSGGLCSWAAAKLVSQKYGTNDLILLFCDTLIEDEDTYRFLNEAAKNVGGELVILKEGRDPWQVFFDSRFLGNTRIDPCSRVLKREMADNWLKENFLPDNCICYVGIHWSESDRFVNIKRRYNNNGWNIEAPLCDKPFLSMEYIKEWSEKEGLKEQRLYQMGFAHANCGGFCVKAGHGHFANLLDKMPDRYAYHEKKEEELRVYLGKDISILSDRSGDNKRKPLTLRQFREKRQEGSSCNMNDLGGCNCFSEEQKNEKRRWYNNN